MTQSFETQVNKFTKNLTATLLTKNITKMEFHQDINNLKSKTFGKRAFKQKYNLLFDGTYAKFKNTYNFLGSYRRNINPNYYNDSKDPDIIHFNQELRANTLTIPKVKKIKIKLTKAKKLLVSTKDSYFERLIFPGFDRFSILALKQVWNLTKIINNKLIASQEVQIVINFNLVDENGNVVYPDMWITKTSGLTRKEPLLKLYDIAYEEFIEWIIRMEQSKLFVDILNAYTQVYRFGD